MVKIKFHCALLPTASWVVIQWMLRMWPFHPVRHSNNKNLRTRSTLIWKDPTWISSQALYNHTTRWIRHQQPFIWMFPILGQPPSRHLTILRDLTTDRCLLHRATEVFSNETFAPITPSISIVFIFDSSLSLFIHLHCTPLFCDMTSSRPCPFYSVMSIFRTNFFYWKMMRFLYYCYTTSTSFTIVLRQVCQVNYLTSTIRMLESMRMNDENGIKEIGVSEYRVL